jgi:hypothetical protein
VLLNLFFAAVSRADDAVNLADLGTEGFTPYLNERHEAWIALPAAAIALLLIHLRKTRKKRGMNR